MADISVDVNNGDTLKEPVDFVAAYYVVDGGVPVKFGKVFGNITAQTFTATDVIGSTLQIIIEADVSTSNETYYFDNIMVSGISVQQALKISTEIGETPNEGEIKVYPNPQSEKLFIDVSSLKLKETNISLFSAIGQLVNKVDLKGGFDHLQEIDLARLDEGLYILRIFNNEGNILKTVSVIIKKK